MVAAHVAFVLNMVNPYPRSFPSPIQWFGVQERALEAQITTAEINDGLDDVENEYDERASHSCTDSSTAWQSLICVAPQSLLHGGAYKWLN